MTDINKEVTVTEIQGQIQAPYWLTQCTNDRKRIFFLLFREHICNTVTFCITKRNLLGLVLLLRGHVKLLLLFKPKKNIWPQVDVIFYKFRVMGRHQNQQNLRDMAPLNALFKTCIYQKQSPFDHGYIVLYSMTSIINYYYTILLFLCTTAYSQNR